jgi:hypothetical protein
MKRLIYFTGVVTAIILITSCQPILLHVAGVRVPQAESKESIYGFLQKMDKDTVDVFALDSNLFNRFRGMPFKPGWQPGFRPIQIRCYDSSGNPVMQWASCEGFLKDLKTFDSVPPKNVNGLDTSLTLQQDLAQYFTLDGNPAQIRPEEGYDYYFLVFFAKFFPKLTKESFRQLSQYAITHPNLRLKVYNINVDIQESWGQDVKVEMEIH